MLFRYCDEAQASLCKCADSPEPSLSAHEILILIPLSNDYAAKALVSLHICAGIVTGQCYKYLDLMRWQPHSGESAHLQRLPLAFVTLPKSRAASNGDLSRATHFSREDSGESAHLSRHSHWTMG